MVPRVLEPGGYTRLAQIGGAAPALSREHGGEIHGLLTDMELGVTTGHEVAVALRGLRPRPRIVRRQAVVIALAAALVAACGSSPGPEVRVVVPSGVTMRVAAESLAHVGVIGSARLFSLYAGVRKRDRNVKPGTYLLRRGAGWNDVLDALVNGKGLVNTVTIPEGWDLADMIPVLSTALHVSAESLQASVADTTLRSELDVPTPTLEGYLFPDTYILPEGITARDVVRTMTANFERHWKPEWDARLQALSMSRHDIVTLASIIEKEAKLPEERPLISAVYHNRLRRGMLLQADPTVQYALGHHVERVLYRDLRVDSPYNTYLHPGLPPGPIAAPGEASIEAALYPADVAYLYFVAEPDGHHEFRRTLREHLAAVQHARAARRAKRP